MTLGKDGGNNLLITRQASSLHGLDVLPWIRDKAGSEVKRAVVVKFHSKGQTGQLSVVNEKTIRGRKSLLGTAGRKSFGNVLGASNSLRILGCRV